MKIYEQRTCTTKVHVDTKCDKCNQSIKTDRFELFEFEFLIKVGDSYPDGEYGNRLEMELCQACTKDLINILKSGGYNLTETTL